MTRAISEYDKAQRRESRLREKLTASEYRLAELEHQLEMTTDKGVKFQVRQSIKNLKASIRRTKRQLGF